MASVFYGPAQARITRTPITFDTSLPTAGLYQTESPIHKIASAILPSLFQPGGKITINPEGTADLSKTTRHEEIHAALDKLNQSGKLDELAAQNPYYSQLKPNVDVGDMPAEMPAYIGTADNAELGIPDILSNKYYGKLVQQLQQLDPNLAKIYQRLKK